MALGDLLVYLSIIGILFIVVERILSYLMARSTLDTVQTANLSTLQSVSSVISASVETGHAERMEVLRTVATTLNMGQMVAASVATGEQLEDLARIAQNRSPPTQAGAAEQS